MKKILFPLLFLAFFNLNTYAGEIEFRNAGLVDEATSTYRVDIYGVGLKDSFDSYGPSKPPHGDTVGHFNFHFDVNVQLDYFSYAIEATSPLVDLRLIPVGPLYAFTVHVNDIPSLTNEEFLGSIMFYNVVENIEFTPDLWLNEPGGPHGRIIAYGTHGAIIKEIHGFVVKKTPLR